MGGDRNRQQQATMAPSRGSNKSNRKNGGKKNMQTQTQKQQKHSAQQIHQLPERPTTRDVTPTSAQREQQGEINNDEASSRRSGVSPHLPRQIVARNSARSRGTNGREGASHTESLSQHTRSIDPNGNFDASYHSHMAKKTTINAITRKHVFPKIKFLNKNSPELNYHENRNSWCKKIVTLANMHNNPNRQLWWNQARLWVASAITMKRNDVTSQIRLVFMGKLIFIVHNKQLCSQCFPRLCYRKKNERIFEMHELLELRENKAVYSLFLSRFVQHTVGVTRFREHIENAKLEILDEEEADRLCTVTDEAFTLVTIENNYNHWVDIVKRNNYSLPKPSKKNEPKQFVSNERPRFTSGGNVYMNDEENENTLKKKGWTAEGIKKYNALFEKVTKDWENYPEFLINFIKEERQQSECNRVGKRPKPKSNPYLQACCDPLSDIEEVDEECSMGSDDSESENPNNQSSQNGRKRRRDDDDQDDDEDEDLDEE